MNLEYLDIIFCHRPDPMTPIEETVRAMNHVIDKVSCETQSHSATANS